MKSPLFLLDSHALIFRAYYALIRRPLINSKGMNTGALFGFCRYLLTLLSDYPDARIAAVFDSPGPTHRKKMYPEYKANRSAVPEDLIPQLSRARDVAHILGVPCFYRDGFEADDLIKDLAYWGRDSGFHVKIVSKDKDLMQLVDDAIHLYTPAKANSFVDMGPREVEEKLGVPPSQVADLLALMGDSSDNVPGVPGIGPKTAVKILSACNTVEELLEDPACAGAKSAVKKIKEHRDKLALSLKLVRLDHDSGLSVTEEDLQRSAPQSGAVQKLFAELEFSSLLKTPYLAENMENGAEKITFESICANSLESVTAIVGEIRRAKAFSFDTETTSLDTQEAELVGISLAVDTHRGWYIPLGHRGEENLPVQDVLSLLKPLLEDEDIGVIGQNLKYDMEVLFKYEIALRGIVFDTMLAAYIIAPDAGRFGLDHIARQWLSYEMKPIEELIGKKGPNQGNFSHLSAEQALFYAVEDAVIPLHLQKIFTEKLVESRQESVYYSLELPLIGVLAAMEYHGFQIDRRRLGDLEVSYRDQIDHLARTIFDAAGQTFNLNSPKQLGTVLFDVLGLPPGRKTKTGYSTDVQVLENLAGEYPVVGDILRYREKQKLYSTYIHALPEKVNPRTGRLHTDLRQTGTATGRISSRNPNLQNIPVRTDEGREIRRAFVCPDGMEILAADYSQIELRLLAHFSRDPLLLDAFAHDRDIHRETAAAFFDVAPEEVSDEMRRTAKVINFGLMYGMGPYKLSQDLSVSFQKAREFIDRYFARFNTIRDFMEEYKARAAETGYSETLFGRRRWIAGINSSNRRIRDGARRLAVNTPVQGSAADIIKKAMIDISPDLDACNAHMLLQVHDELIFEVPREHGQALQKMVVERMENAADLDVPLRVSAARGATWSDAH
ncbi:MAG: DNA polymerase I [Fibrobacterota bacterium]